MKIPLVYPKIPDTTNCPLKQCSAYVKYDGTNLHWYWHKEHGWEFGTRRNRYPLNQDGIAEFNQNHPGLSEALDLFEEYKFLSDYLVKTYNATEFLLFTEFFGEHSFAGEHEINDLKQLMLIGNLVYNGVYLPSFEIEKDLRQFEKNDFHVAEIFYQGKYSGQLVEDIRNGKYPLNEGAVLKGLVQKHGLYMAKVKTNVYMEKLKLKFKDNWKDYWE